MAAAGQLRFRGIKKSPYQQQFLNGSMIEDTTDKGGQPSGPIRVIGSSTPARRCRDRSA
jgi:hypothetical protein